MDEIKEKECKHNFLTNTDLTDNTSKSDLCGLGDTILTNKLMLVSESLLGRRNRGARDEVTKATRLEVMTKTEFAEVDELAAATGSLNSLLHSSRGMRNFNIDRDGKTSNLINTLTEKLNTILETTDNISIKKILQSDSLGRINTALANVINKLANIKRIERLTVDVLETTLRRTTPKHGLTTFITHTTSSTRTSVLTLLTTTSSLTKTGATTTTKNTLTSERAGDRGQVIESNGRHRTESKLIRLEERSVKGRLGNCGNSTCHGS